MEPVVKTLEFEITVTAPRVSVWNTMLQPETYKAWAAAFSEGSYYTGSWNQGAQIRFLSPSGDGMTSVIAENRQYQFVSIRHLGVIEHGAEDTTSEKVRAWAPAHENYRFSDAAGGCLFTVAADTTPEYAPYMLEAFPKALGLLKKLCEQ